MDPSAFEAFNGLRIPLPNGKTFVTTKPLLFRTALRWLELLDAFNRGAPYSETLKPILDELPSAVGAEDLSVLEDLTLGEVIDHTVYRFFSQRRAVPEWIVTPKGPESPTGASPSA